MRQPGRLALVHIRSAQTYRLTDMCTSISPSNTHYASRIVRPWPSRPPPQVKRLITTPAPLPFSPSPRPPPRPRPSSSLVQSWSPQREYRFLTKRSIGPGRLDHLYSTTPWTTISNPIPYHILQLIHTTHGSHHSRRPFRVSVSTLVTARLQPDRRQLARGERLVRTPPKDQQTKPLVTNIFSLIIRNYHLRCWLCSCPWILLLLLLRR